MMSRTKLSKNTITAKADSRITDQKVQAIEMIQQIYYLRLNNISDTLKSLSSCLETLLPVL